MRPLARGQGRPSRMRTGCLYRKSDSAIMAMKSSADGRRYDAAHVLDRATDRSFLVERPMSPQLIIISGILRQYPAQVRFAQNNHMVDALASDRSISLSAKPFCQGEPGAIGLSRIPMA